MEHMPDIVPISELRQDATNIVKRAEDTGNPIFVTQHGKPSAVVLSTDAYEKVLKDIDELAMIKSIQQGIAEAKAGMGRDASEVMAELRAMLGGP